MTNIRLLVATLGALLLLSLPAFAQDTVVPADSEDVNAFDQAITQSKNKFSEEKANKHSGDSTMNQEKYMEQHKAGEAKEEGEGKKVMTKEQTRTKEQEKKAVKAKKEKAVKEAVAKEVKKMKKEGDVLMIQERDRVRTESRQGELNGAVNSYGPDSGAGSKGSSEVIPDAGKKPETAGTPGGNQEQGSGQQGGK
jgi:hypothetical protein